MIEPDLWILLLMLMALVLKTMRFKVSTMDIEAELLILFCYKQ